MDELRSEIWDHLYRLRRSQSLDDLSRLTGQPRERIEAVVAHGWFLTAGEFISIAYNAPEPPRHG